MLLLIVASGPDAGRLTIWSPMLRGPTGRSTVRKYCVKTLHTMPGSLVRNMYGQFRGRDRSGMGIRRGRSHDPGRPGRVRPTGSGRGLTGSAEAVAGAGPVRSPASQPDRSVPRGGRGAGRLRQNSLPNIAIRRTRGEA